MSLSRVIGGWIFRSILVLGPMLAMGLFLAISPILAVDKSHVDKASKLVAIKVDEIDLEGWYSFEGSVVGDTYNGVSRIRLMPNGNLMMSWYGSETGQGVGMRDGHELIVGWYAGQLGVTRFQIEVDDAGKPRLIGEWVNLQGLKGRHKETMTWLKAATPKREE